MLFIGSVRAWSDVSTLWLRFKAEVIDCSQDISSDQLLNPNNPSFDEWKSFTAFLCALGAMITQPTVESDSQGRKVRKSEFGVIDRRKVDQLLQEMVSLLNCKNIHVRDTVCILLSLSLSEFSL